MHHTTEKKYTFQIIEFTKIKLNFATKIKHYEI